MDPMLLRQRILQEIRDEVNAETETCGIHEKTIQTLNLRFFGVLERLRQENLIPAFIASRPVPELFWIVTDLSSPVGGPASIQVAATGAMDLFLAELQNAGDRPLQEILDTWRQEWETTLYN